MVYVAFALGLTLLATSCGVNNGASSVVKDDYPAWEEEAKGPDNYLLNQFKNGGASTSGYGLNFAPDVMNMLNSVTPDGRAACGGSIGAGYAALWLSMSESCQNLSGEDLDDVQVVAFIPNSNFRRSAEIVLTVRPDGPPRWRYAVGVGRISIKQGIYMVEELCTGEYSEACRVDLSGERIRVMIPQPWHGNGI